MKSLVPIKEIENEKIISQHALQRCDFYTISNFFYVIATGFEGCLKGTCQLHDWR